MLFTACKPVRSATLDVSRLGEIGPAFRFLVIEEAVVAAGADSNLTTLPEGIEAIAQGAPSAQLLDAGAWAGFLVYPFLQSARVTVGRRSKSDLVIRHRKISGVHAALAPAPNDGTWLADLASSNGTFVEGRCLAPGESGRVRIEPGARLSLGKVELRFVDGAHLRVLAAERR